MALTEYRGTSVCHTLLPGEKFVGLLIDDGTPGADAPLKITGQLAPISSHKSAAGCSLDMGKSGQLLVQLVVAQIPELSILIFYEEHRVVGAAEHSVQTLRTGSSPPPVSPALPLLSSPYLLFPCGSSP